MVERLPKEEKVGGSIPSQATMSEEIYTVIQEFPEEKLPEGPTNDKWFLRYLCDACTSKNLIGIIQLKDNKRICFICFEQCKKISELKLDAIHELDIKAVKKYLTPKVEEKSEHILQEDPKRLRRRRRSVEPKV